MKEQLLKLADAYANHRMMDGAQDVEASQQSVNARVKLEDAIDAALAKARMDALEEAAEYFQLNDTNLFWGSQAAREVRALKDMYTNPQNLDTSVERVQIIHDSIQPDIEGHPV